MFDNEFSEEQEVVDFQIDGTILGNLYLTYADDTIFCEWTPFPFHEWTQLRPAYRGWIVKLAREKRRHEEIQAFKREKAAS